MKISYKNNLIAFGGILLFRIATVQTAKSQILFNKIEVGFGLSGPKALDADHPIKDIFSAPLRVDIPNLL